MPWSLTATRTRSAQRSTLTSIDAPEFGKFQGVREQVVEDLLQPRRIGVDAQALGAFGDGEGYRPRVVDPSALERLQEYGLDLDRLQGQSEGAPADLRQIEEIIDDPDQPFAVALRQLDRLAHRRRHLSQRFAVDQRDYPADRRQRRAEFVTDHRDEIVLDPARLHQFAGALLDLLLQCLMQRRQPRVHFLVAAQRHFEGGEALGQERRGAAEIVTNGVRRSGRDDPVDGFVMERHLIEHAVALVEHRAAELIGVRQRRFIGVGDVIDQRRGIFIPQIWPRVHFALDPT